MYGLENNKVYRVALISMPFATARLPSIALTQLCSVLRQRFDGLVECDIHYLNHDFVQHFGKERYQQISESAQVTTSGFGDWLFRQIAFPQLKDNSIEYTRRYGLSLNSEFTLLESHDGMYDRLEIFLDELIERYNLHQYSLIGFSSMFTQNMASFAMARRIKRQCPKIVTVIGGANCEMTMGSVIARNVEAIDFVFSGPALKTFPQLIEYLIEKKEEKCHGIVGVYSRQKLENIEDLNLKEIGEELSIKTQISLDYRGYLDSLERKSPGTEPSLLFETSRGCWWGERSHCTFCGLNGSTMKYRAMEPAQALGQFDKMFEYWPRVSRFESVDNILPRQYFKSVLPHIKPPERVRIFYEIKADVKEHEMHLLAKAGITELQPGIEALATSTLKLMKKGTTSFQNLKFLKNCLVYGIKPVWNLLIGFPGEEEAVYRKYMDDLPLLNHLPPPSGVYPVRFDRYSPYHTHADTYGLELKPYDFYSLVYPFSDEDLNNMAYFFADIKYDNPYIANTAKWLKELKTLSDLWNERWQVQGINPRLEIEWRGNKKIVCDTRSKTFKDHDIGPTGFEVLSALDRPQNIIHLARLFNDISGAELDRQILSLRDRKLIFVEDDRYMSLVVDMGRDQGYL